MKSTIYYILNNKRYRLIAVVSTIIIFSIFYYLTVTNVYRKSILIYAQMNGIAFTITSLILSLILSSLIGLYLSLVVYNVDRIRLMHNKSNIITIGSIFLGTAATGCPSCGIPLLALFGFPLALISLPLKGLEIKLLSIFIIFLSIYLVARRLPRP